MEPEAYLKKHQLLTYVEDAVTLLLERRDEDPNTKPFQLLTDYFESVLNGSHILFREYSFISATPHNRRSFIATFWQAFQKVAERGVAMSAFEYHSLLKLLCTDFPLEVTQKVGNVLSRRCDIIPFPDFAYTFQLVFYFEHFLQQLESVYSDLVLGTYRSPSSEGNPHSSHAVVVPLPPRSSGDCTSPCSNAQDSE